MVNKNSKIPPSPFPRQGEIIRAIANALGSKLNNKNIDDYVRNGDTDFKLRDKVIDEVVFDPIKKHICSDLALELRDLTRNMCDEYLKKVTTIALPAATRVETLPALVDHFFAPYFRRFLSSESRTWLESNILKIPSQNISTIDALINWQNKHIKNWDEELKTDLGNAERDKLRKWQKKDELPSVVAITLLFQKVPDEFQKLKRILLIARSIDFMKRSELGRQCIKAKIVSTLEPVHFPRRQIQTSETIRESLKYVRNSLFEHHERGVDEQQNTRQKLNEISQEYFLLNLDSSGFLVDLYMYEARWQLFSGENDKAVENYTKAFEYSLFRSGVGQLKVIKESIIVAAKLNARILLTRLKNQAIAFGIYERPLENDELDTQINSKKSRSKLNIVEDWEVQCWSNQFHSMFPVSMFFKPEAAEIFSFSVGMSKSEMAKIKPNTRYPDKDLIIDVLGWKKKQPQLVWFSNQNKPEAVQQCLTAGAFVDKCSDSGDTAILMALLHMDTQNQTKGLFFSEDDLDSRCFDLISSYPHKHETMNRRTSKKRLLPLMCAVGTGRPEVVKKVLDMGAEVDRRGELDNMTSLCYCIQLIKQIQNPEATKQKLRHHMKHRTQKMKYASRRSSGGMPDPPADSPLYQSIQSHFDEQYISKLDFLKVDVLYQIATVLLKAGADPDAEHEINDFMFTPLTFSTELENKRLYEEMLAYRTDHNGDLS